MRNTLLALLATFLLTSCGGGGSNSGAGSDFRVEDTFGRYEGTLGNDVRITLTITKYDLNLVWPLRGSFRVRKADGGCAFEGNWRAYPGAIGVGTYVSDLNVWSGQNLDFDGSSLKSSPGADGRHAAYNGQDLRDCSPRIEGAVNLRKLN